MPPPYTHMQNIEIQPFKPFFKHLILDFLKLDFLKLLKDAQTCLSRLTTLATGPPTG